MARPSEPVQMVYTLQTGDTAVLTFEASSLREAMSLPREKWLLSDLIEARSNGAPVWDGTSKIAVRRSTPDEAMRFQQSKAGAADDCEDLVLVFLAELDGRVAR